MAKKIMLIKDRTPARPTIRQVASDSALDYAMAGTRATAGLTDLESIIAGISSQLGCTAQVVRPLRRGRSRTRIIAISHFEEVRFELEIKSTGVPGDAGGRTANGSKTVNASKPGALKPIRKSMPRGAKN